MTTTEAIAAVGGGQGLSHTSKMPGPSAGISPNRCPTGSKLALIPGSTCSICYAKRHMYAWRTTKDAHERRYQALAPAFAAVDLDARPIAYGPDAWHWVSAMAKLVQPHKHFRWFDSGDLQNVAHLALIAQVCYRTPDTRHWLPTQEYSTVSQGLARLVRPSNLVIRLSAPMIDNIAPALTLAKRLRVKASGVHTKLAPSTARACPASTQGGECGPCRACWDPTVRAVSYPKH